MYNFLPFEDIQTSSGRTLQEAMGPTRSRSRSRSSHRNPRGNRFDDLDNDVMEHEIVNNESSINARYMLKNKKPPPITVCNISIMDLRHQLSLIKDIDQQKLLIRITQHGTKVFSQNNNEFNILKKFFTDKNIHYYTHTLYDERRVKICLYGLYKMNVNELKNELSTTHKIRPVDIKIIEPRIQNKRYDEECIYILYFQKKDNMKIEMLKKITGLFNIKVNWKYYSSKSHGPTQCSNCQDFGHGTENCRMKPKCIRCSGVHNSSKCPLLPKTAPDSKGNSVPDIKSKIPDDKIKCANCGSNHTANFRGCNYRKQFIELKQQIRPRNKQNRFSAPLFNETNFPQLPRIDPKINKTTQFNNNNIFQQAPPNGLLSYTECSQIMSELLERLPQCQSRNDQIQLICEISFKYTYGSP